MDPFIVRMNRFILCFLKPDENLLQRQKKKKVKYSPIDGLDGSTEFGVCVCVCRFTHLHQPIVQLSW